MTAAAPPDTAEDFIHRLFAAEGPAHAALIAAPGLSAAGLHEAVLALVAEAERVLGADPRRMERLCLDARALAEQADDDFLRAMAAMRHGDYFRFAGRNADARELYDAAAAIFTRLGRPVEAARTRIGWVWATAALGHPDEALGAARTARRILVAHGEMLRAAGVDLSIVLLHLEQGRYRAAFRVLMRAMAIYQALGEVGQLGLARGHANCGLILTRLGRYAEAFKEFELAREAYQRMGEAVGSARVSRHMGEAAMEIGRYASALRSFEQTRSVFRRLDLRNEAAQVAPVLAECYLYLNRPADALTALDEAEPDLARTDGAQVAEAVALRRVAASLALGERERAVSVLDATERRFNTGATLDRAWLLEQRATLVLRDGDAPGALALARRAHTLARAAGARRRVAAARLVEGAALLALDRSAEAGEVAARARRLARLVDAAPLLARSYDLLGRVAEAQDRAPVARRHYAAAIEQIEREQRGVIFEFRDSFAADRGAAYERLARLQLCAGRVADALYTAERAKSRALAEAIAGAVDLRPRGNSESRRLVRQLDRARGEYAAAAAAASRSQPASDDNNERTRRQLAELERRIADLVRRLQLAGASDDATLYGATPAPALPELPPDTAMIEYFVSGEDILRFWVDHRGVRGELLAGMLPEAERLLRTLRLNFELASRASAGAQMPRGLAEQARRILARLEERLLGGLGDLSAYRSLVIVPHGLLHYLPFHAFHDGTRYLVERVAVSYAPSAAIYEVCRARVHRRHRRAGALVLAHSAGGRLPHTLDEADAVGALLAAPVYAEAAATRALLEGAGRRAGLLHIAAHGVFRPDAPLFSTIELADGPLTTADIFSLELRADVVALSACETGRAVVGGGDELAGFARAFLYAGARSLLVSQWRVDDRSTAMLMTGFYRALAAGAGPAAALRTAQTQMIEREILESEEVHPFSWAGFQTIGG